MYSFGILAKWQDKCHLYELRAAPRNETIGLRQRGTSCFDVHSLFGVKTPNSE
jgi:hypothetical protein